MTALAGFGTCPCGGVYETQPVEVRMLVDDHSVTLSDVPQGRCPVCGSRVYSAAELAAIESLFQGNPARAAAPPD
jgi:YgiT-type zinc finger domain-containing protein